MVADRTDTVITVTALSLPLRTDRLLLRAYRDDDLDAALDYYTNPIVARYLLEDPWSREYAQKQIDKRVDRTDIHKSSAALALVVEHQREVIGDVALWPTDTTLSRGELGWVFHPQASGKGFATEAVRALVELAFGHYGMHRVVAQLDARNTASAKLCERIGMRKEAHLRRDWWSKGEWTDNVIYGVLADEWFTQRPAVS